MQRRDHGVRRARAIVRPQGVMCRPCRRRASVSSIRRSYGSASRTGSRQREGLAFFAGLLIALILITYIPDLSLGLVRLLGTGLAALRERTEASLLFLFRF